MASAVDICNLALAHLGDTATVSSISPPEGSTQASHCARFYPMARNALLEMHTWGFATKRAALALNSTNATSTWDYAYTPPSDAMNYIAVLDPEATDEYSSAVAVTGAGPNGFPNINLGVYTPQNFEVETDDEGNDVIYTNVEDAVLRYTFVATDTTKFTPLFVLALSHMLASMLAGPLLKGESGERAASDQLKKAGMFTEKAKASDASQRQVRPTHGAAWMIRR